MAVSAVVVYGEVPNGDTSTTVDLEVAGFGAPEAAIVFLSNAGTGANPRTTNGLYGVGFWDGTNQGCATTHWQNSGTKIYSGRYADDEHIAQAKYYNGTSHLHYADYSISQAPGGNGVRITLSYDNTSASRYVMAVLFKGLANKKIVWQTLSGSATTTVNTVGFQPDVVFYLNPGATNTTDNESTISYQDFGICHRNSSGTLTQHGISWSIDNNVTTTVANASVYENYIDRWYISDGSSSSTYTLSDFNSSGFTINQSGAATSNRLMLCLELDDPDAFYLGIDSAKTGTPATQSFSLGFTPEAVGIFVARNTTTNSGGHGQGVTFGLADDTREVSHVQGMTDGVAATGATCWNRVDQASILNVRADDDTVDAVATVDSFGTNDFTISYSDYASSAWKMLVWGIGNAASGTTVNLTGLAATGAVGSLGKAHSKALTGLAATGAVGLLSPEVGSSPVTVNLDGVAGTGAVGSLSLSCQLALTGIEATGAIGLLSSAHQHALSGLSADGAVGLLSPSVDVSISGFEATGSVGSFFASINTTISGLEATGVVGSVTTIVGTGAPLYGIAATGSVGSLSLSTRLDLSGVAASGDVGTLSPSSGKTVELTGVGASGSVGSLSLEIVVDLTGVSAAGTVGGLGVSTPTLIELTGVAATGAVGTLSAALTLEQKCNLVLKLLMNKQTTDPATGIMTIYDDDDVTPLYTANVYEDVAGTIPYRGQGIDRRNRMT